MNTLTTSLIMFTASALTSAHAEKRTLQKSGESDLLLIRAQTGFSTLVEFPPDQEIVEVACGDKEFWVVEVKGRFLHVKPAKPGAVTNLNVIVKGDIVHSFLLKEITKSGGKDKPDLRVIVPRVEDDGRPVVAAALSDELLKLKKDKENLEEALARAEREARQLKEHSESEKKQAQKKTEDELPIDKAALVDPKPPVAEARGDLRILDGTQQLTPASPAVTTASTEEAPIARSYTIERKDGLLRTSGRAWGWLMRKVNRVLRLY